MFLLPSIVVPFELRLRYTVVVTEYLGCLTCSSICTSSAHMHLSVVEACSFQSN